MKASWCGIKKIILVSMSIFMMCSLSACNETTKQKKEYREQALEFMKTEDYSAAIAYFDKALSLNDGKVGDLEIDMLKYRAEAEIKIEDYEAAAYSYGLLMEHEAEKPAYQDLFCYCTVKSNGSLQKALDAYLKAEEYDPHSPQHKETLEELGDALVKSGNPELKEKAIDLYKIALGDEERKSAELYNRMGMLYFEEDRTETAQEYFELGLKTIRIEQENGDAADANAAVELEKNLRYNIAVCLEYKKDFKAAYQAFKEYTEKYGEDEAVMHEILFLEKEIE